MAQGVDVHQLAQRRYWREAEGQTAVTAWRSSGERVKDFARRYGVNPKRVLWWARRLGTQESMRFHPVRLVGPRVEPDGLIEIELRDGRRVHLPRRFDEEDLRRVLRVLEELSPC
jgi:transposase-like protein